MPRGKDSNVSISQPFLLGRHFIDISSLLPHVPMSHAQGVNARTDLPSTLPITTPPHQLGLPTSVAHAEPFNSSFPSVFST